MLLKNALIGKNKAAWVLILIGAAAVSMGASIWRHPILYETKKVSEVNLQKILINQSEYLGVYRGHRIFVSLGDIADQRYRDLLMNMNCALVVPIYLSTEPQKSQIFRGFIINSALSGIGEASPEELVRTRNQVGAIDRYRKAEVVEVPLNIPKERRRLFPFNRLLVASLPHGGVTSEDIDSAIKAVLSKDADGDRIIIPPLTVRLDNGKGGLSPYEIYRAVFGNISPSTANDIDFHIYSAWPSAMIENAADDLESAWAQAASTPDALPLYDPYFRTGILAFIMTVLLLTFAHEFTFGAFVTSMIAFAGTMTGIKGAVDAFNLSPWTSISLLMAMPPIFLLVARKYPKLLGLV